MGILIAANVMVIHIKAMFETTTLQDALKLVDGSNGLLSLYNITRRISLQLDLPTACNAQTYF